MRTPSLRDANNLPRLLFNTSGKTSNGDEQIKHCGCTVRDKYQHAGIRTRGRHRRMRPTRVVVSLEIEIEPPRCIPSECVVSEVCPLNTMLTASSTLPPNLRGGSLLRRWERETPWPCNALRKLPTCAVVGFAMTHVPMATGFRPTRQVCWWSLHPERNPHQARKTLYHEP